jgi:uncharacterized membrane protein YphA (DoxX/SURF4 family)
MIATLFETAPIVLGSCAAGIAVLVIAAFATRKELAGAGGLDKLVALSHLCFAIPLAVFGAEHLFGAGAVAPLVPQYMPGRMFWVYFVGVALVAASLSIATRTWVRWSGLLFGLMMFLFVAMIHLPGALAQHDRVLWVIVCRESSFGGAGWLLAASAMDAAQGRPRNTLMTVGRVCVALAALVFGVQHFVHPTLLPGVPLRKELATWIPARVLIDYVTGAALLVTAATIVSGRQTRTAATLLGGWLLLMVLVIYGPISITALSQRNTGIQMEGINYFADTLLFAGVILALARATPRPA